jgi:CHAD domain-containing protein
MPRLKHIEKVDQLEDYCEQRLGEWKTELCEQGKYVRMLRRKPLHRLRIRSKYYRYMVEALLDSDIPVPREEFSFCETARRIHRTLGELRDLKLLHKATGRKPPRYRKRERALIRQVADMFFPFVGTPARVK